MDETVKTLEAADIAVVLKMLPHRYPFLMVDRVIEIRGDDSGIGIKNVTINEPQFQGHFPGNPVFPGVLMIEGMAIAGAEDVFPYQSREMYLHFDTQELTAQQRALAQNAAQYLTLVRASVPPEQYEQWFTKSHFSEAPSRGGYLLGYEVTKRVMATYGLEQMVRMTPAELREHAEEQLAAMSYDSVLLMASH